MVFLVNANESSIVFKHCLIEVFHQDATLASNLRSIENSYLMGGTILSRRRRICLGESDECVVSREP